MAVLPEVKAWDVYVPGLSSFLELSEPVSLEGPANPLPEGLLICGDSGPSLGAD